MKKNNLIGTIITILVLAGVGIFIYFLVSNTMAENVFTVEDSKLIIEGQYSKTISLSDIDEVDLLDSVPNIIRKVNGAGLKGISKGVFELEGYGKCDLYIHSSAGKCILITTSDRPVLIALYEEEDTLALYDELLSALSD